jgi:hypothetical protein
LVKNPSFRGFTSPSSIHFWNFSANPLALQFIQLHMLRSLYGLLSSWWAFTHLSQCLRVDSIMVLTITVTISTSSLYHRWREFLCWVVFTHEIAALLSTHFMHLLVDSIWWNFIKWNSNRFGAAIPNNSARVELRTKGTPSTDPTPWIRTFWFPISNHPKEAVSFQRLSDPSVLIFRGLSFFRQCFSISLLPGTNLTCISSHCMVW